MGMGLIIIITRMKVLLLLSFVAFTSIHLVQGGCKAKVSNAVINQKLKPFTVVDKKGKPVATAPCWWDLTRENCGKCKKGGRQCGFPMHKKCDGNLASCVTIPYCGAGASCNKKSGR